MSDPNWEGFARDLLEEWPVRDVDASEFFETALRHGLIHEIPGGYDPEQHIDAEGICPEIGDPWYEYAFNADERPAALDALLAKARDDALREAASVCRDNAPRIEHDSTQDDRMHESILERAARHIEALIDRTAERGA